MHRRHAAIWLLVLIVLVGTARLVWGATTCSVGFSCLYLPEVVTPTPIQVLSVSYFDGYGEGYKSSTCSSYLAVRVQNVGLTPVQSAHMQGSVSWDYNPNNYKAGPYDADLPYLLFPGDATTIPLWIGYGEEHVCETRLGSSRFSVTQLTLAPDARRLTILSASAGDFISCPYASTLITGEVRNDTPFRLTTLQVRLSVDAHDRWGIHDSSTQVDATVLAPGETAHFQTTMTWDSDLGWFICSSYPSPRPPPPSLNASAWGLPTH